MPKKSRTGGRADGAGGAGGPGEPSGATRASGVGGRAGRSQRSETDSRSSAARPTAWWPFWGTFLFIVITAGVAIAYGELQMRNLRASVEGLHSEMSAISTSLESREGQFSELISQAEFRLTSTVEEAVTRETREPRAVPAIASRLGSGAGLGSGIPGNDESSQGGIYVRVRPGDSLWEISRALWGRGALYPTLAEENELNPQEPLPVNLLLRVPNTGG